VIVDTRLVIAVPDLEQSAAFYRDVLEFEIREIGDPGWRMYVRDNCSILAGECPGAMPVRELGDHSYFAYLVVDDVDAEYARVRATGTEIIKHVRSEPWRMREFGLRTVDGHRIMLGQRLLS
jgi:predicted enzyme related to lactoylglutathione lyase